MNTLTIQSLHAEFMSAPEYTPEHAAAFFEKYARYLETVDPLPDSTELHVFIELAWQHLHMLNEKNSYAAVLSASTTYLTIIDRESRRLGCHLAGDEWYDCLLFIRGMAAYRLGTYPVSTPIFRRLSHDNRENGQFALWYHYSVYQQYRRTSNIVMILSAILLLVVLVFDKKISSFLLKFILLGIVFVGSIGSLCFDQYMKRVIKKARQLTEK